MNRHSEIVTNEAVSIETYVDGDGPDVVVIPSYGRGGRPNRAARDQLGPDARR